MLPLLLSTTGQSLWVTAASAVSTGARGTLGLNYKRTLANNSVVTAPLSAGVSGGVETLQAKLLQIELTTSSATCNPGEKAGINPLSHDLSAVRKHALSACWQLQ